MNLNLKTYFYKLAQDLKLKGDVNSLIKNAFKDRHVNYLDKCESVFAVSRLYCFVKGESLETRLKDFNKKWLDYLITHDASNELHPYIDKYGRATVKKAVMYALENNLWSSPTGKDSLDRKSPEHRAFLEVIDEIVTFLNSESTDSVDIIKELETITGETVVATNSEPVPEKKKEVEIVEEKPTKTMDDVISPDKARLAFALIDEQVIALKDSYEMLKTYINQDTITDLYEEENETLKNKLSVIDTENENLRIEIVSLQKELKDTVAELKKITKVRDEAVDTATNLSKELTRVKERKVELENTINTMLKTPKCAKVIPLSDLKKQPLVGAKLLTLLVDFLSKYDIKVDLNK